MQWYRVFVEWKAEIDGDVLKCSHWIKNISSAMWHCINRWIRIRNVLFHIFTKKHNCNEIENQKLVKWNQFSTE